METSLSSKDMVFEIIDEIGIDIDYARHKKGAPVGRLYFTGIELAVLIGTGTLASAFLGFAKEVGKVITGELGKATGKAIVKRLQGIVSGILKTEPKNAVEAQGQALLFQQQLDDVVNNDLGRLISRADWAEAFELAHESEVHEVKTFLTKSGLTTEISSVHCKKVIKIIRARISP